MAQADDSPDTQVVEEKPATAVNVQGLSKTYRSEVRAQKALSSINLRITKGEMIAVLGKSGSGKTTLLNVLGGLDTAYEGEVHVNGQALHELSAKELAQYRREQVGFVFQHFVLRPDLNCLENVMLPATLAGDDAESSQLEAARLLAAVGLGDLLLEAPTKMSGGQRQRVAIARALLGKPSLLLCDEPTGALDEQTGRHIMALLCSLQQQLQFAAVIVSHEESVAAVAGRQIRLRDGSICEELKHAQKPDDALMTPQNGLLPSLAETQKLLDATLQQQRERRLAERPKKLATALFSSAIVLAATLASLRLATSQWSWRWLGVLGCIVCAALLLKRKKGPAESSVTRAARPDESTDSQPGKSSNEVSPQSQNIVEATAAPVDNP